MAGPLLRTLLRTPSPEPFPEPSQNPSWNAVLLYDPLGVHPKDTQWARRDRLMSRGKNCRETIFVSHLSRNYPHRGVNFERG